MTADLPLGVMTSTGADPGRDELLLSVHDIDFAYGQLQVLFGISVEVVRGEALALLGTNGAGSSRSFASSRASNGRPGDLSSSTAGTSRGWRQNGSPARDWS